MPSLIYWDDQDRDKHLPRRHPGVYATAGWDQQFFQTKNAGRDVPPRRYRSKP